jgi:methyl-accepting chemotaxis protein
LDRPLPLKVSGRAILLDRPLPLKVSGRAILLDRPLPLKVSGRAILLDSRIIAEEVNMPSANQRRVYFIDRSFQLKFIAQFCLIVILASLLIGTVLFIFSLNSTTVVIENARVVVKCTADFILPLVTQTIIIATIFCASAVIILVLLTSHKIAGPLYRFRKEIEKLSDGNLNVSFNVRTSDQLKDLASALNVMTFSLRGKIESLRREFVELRTLIEAVSHPEKDKLIEKLKNIEAKLNNFKGL